MKTTKAICVWPDTIGEKNDDGSDRWIVSRDELDEQGRADITHTIDVCDTEDEAMEVAKASAIKEQLPLYKDASDRPATCVYPPATVAMAAVLDAHGDRYSGNCVWDAAEDWCDHGFDADDADPWMEAGFWDASAAAIVRDMGLTAAQARERADALVEAAEDAAEVYTDGDPIYAICNCDIRADVLATDDDEAE